MHTAQVDQCMYGQTVRRGQETGLAKKPTGFATNSLRIKQAIEVRCDGRHSHMQLIGGLASQAAAYPDRLVDAILKGIHKELEEAGRLMAVDEAGPTVEEQDPAEEYMHEYWDEVTGEPLDPELVLQARHLEVDYMHKLRVYEEATEEECKADGCVPIPMRWIDINKGDSSQVVVRSRAVLQETKRRTTIRPNDFAATFAATPPLEGLRMIMSMAMTGQRESSAKQRRILGFYDASRAHFHSPAKRRMYVKTLPEDTRVTTGIARLLKAMYGGKDAGACWDQFCDDVMAKLGYTAGTFSPCLYHNDKTDGACFRHGDDFALLASRDEHARFHAEANKLMILKLEGILGPSKQLGDLQEVRCLNRLIRWVQPAFQSEDKAYLEWEADPRHVQILMANFGFTETSKGIAQPGAKMDKAADLSPLNVAESKTYRSNTMRVAYLAQDRIDIQFASKELARGMQTPTRWDMEQLKRMVRYLKTVPRMVQRFHQQDTPTRLVCFTDSDFAGCMRSRKSTSCNIMFWGSHMIRAASSTQAVISLSSGEAEFYSAVKGASVSIGCVAMMKDLGVVPGKPPLLRVDSTACLGMTGRRGAGRIRHIATPCLWIQRVVSKGELEIDKVEGTKNPADIGTKVLAGSTISRILEQCGYIALQGNSRMALKAAV